MQTYTGSSSNYEESLSNSTFGALGYSGKVYIQLSLMEEREQGAGCTAMCHNHNT